MFLKVFMGVSKMILPEKIKDEDNWLNEVETIPMDAERAAWISSNLEKMSAVDLGHLIKLAQQAYEKVHDRETDQVLAKVSQMLDEHGLDIDELFRRSEMTKTRSTEEPVRFRHPKNPELTWTGRGRLPRWLKEIKDEGGDIEEFRIRH